jgi:hypothetical protein
VRIRALLSILLLALLADGCDYFKPAQPEAPTSAPFTADYSSPEATLETISKAIHDKARTIGLTAYGQAFAESTSAATPAYHQFFWPAEEQEWALHHSVPVWTLTTEKNFYIKLVGLFPDAYDLLWVPDQNLPDTSNPTGDVVYLHRHYLVRRATEAGDEIGKVAIGFADLTLVLQGDQWKITIWQDRIDPNADPNDPDQLTMGRRRLNTTL